MAAFISAQSLAKPEEYDDPDATANAALGARLPYMFACCRFAHYLKCIERDKNGSFSNREQLKTEERSEGQECGSTWRLRWSPKHINKRNTMKKKRTKSV